MNRAIKRYETRTRRLAQAGFTLMEIMVALLLAAMSSAGIIRGIVLAKGLNQASEQRVVAFSLAKSQMEEVKGRSFSSLVAGNTFESSLPMTHLGGETQTSIECSRFTFIIDQPFPPRKEVFVLVRWNYRGRLMSEWIRGVVYEK